jgi:hypothetical protein
MSTFEWIAVIGAAAWLPQIGMAAYRLFVKPRLHFVAVPQTELTFNSLGPILNIRASLVAERKDAVIVEMRLILRHERGRELLFLWDSFVEHFSELKTQAGERGEFTRDQVATALKVNTALPVEKFFRFQDPGFKAGYREVVAKAGDALNRVPKDDAQALEAFFRSKPYTDLVSFYNNAFCWEAGRYDVTLLTTVLGLRQPRVARTSFMLSTEDVDRIRQNLPVIEQRLHDISVGVPPEKQALPGNWANPHLGTTALSLRKP